MAGDNCIVIALDFGSTYIGYAFSHDEECREIFTASSDGYKERIPNAVLLNADKDLDCIGEAAKRKYVDLTEKGTHRAWFYFEWYKTMLHKTEHLTRDLKVYDSEGRPISGMLLFGMVIQYMKRQAEKQIVQALVGIQIDEINWVLTVPAIWSDSAKQFMREAAYRAGIDAERLKLVLEPEAAAAHCLDKPMFVVVKQVGKTKYEKFHPGQKYILADLGGGTVDICIHEVIEDDKVREIHRAIGDIIGGNNVNISFEQLFVKLFGAPTWMKFKAEYMDDYVDLMSNFETKKREFEESELDTLSDEIIIRIPIGLQDVVREEYNTSFADVLQDTTYVDRIHFRRNKMILKHSVMEELFQKPVQSIIEQLKNLLREMAAIGEFISVLVMVGGFSESKYVRQKVQAEIQGVCVIYPTEGSLAVMKGAVKMGFRRQNPYIKERRAQFTYGFSVCEGFKPGLHPETFKYTFDGEDWCEGIFKKLIEKGSLLCQDNEFGFFSENQFYQEESKTCPVSYRVYKSERENPLYCSEDCIQIGEVIVNPPTNGWPGLVIFRILLIVGETEFLVKVTNFSTKESYTAKLDFL